MTKFRERLLFLWDKARPSKIARDLKWSASGVSRILDKDTMPKAETLVAIQKLKGCDWHWLMTGEGEPFPGSADSSSRHAMNLKENNTPYTISNQKADITDFVFIPYYCHTDITASPQCTAPADHSPALPFRRDWITTQVQASPDNLNVFCIEDDSMKDILNEGDYILIDRTQNTPANGIYAFKINQHVMIRQMQIMPEQKLWIKPFNETYDPFGIDLSNQPADMEIIGKVIWVGQLL